MTTTTSTDTYVLTRQDIRALRNADSVTFHTNEGRGFVRAHQDKENSSTGFEQHHDIAADIHLANYQGPGVETGWTAFHMVHSARFSDTWPSIQRRIQAGCSLTLAWVRGNDNEWMKDAGFHTDELRLIITRGDKAERYTVGYSTGPDNSGRMIRPA